MQYPSQIKTLHRLLPLKLMRGRVPPLSSIKKVLICLVLLLVKEIAWLLLFIVIYKSTFTA